MRLTAVGLLALGMLAGCAGTTSDTTDATASSSSSSTATSLALAQTQNVSFRGTVAPAGISIYMEGTHRLELADGRFLLLESTTVDLAAAVGTTVEVEGAVRPTVEAGGVIMNVTRLTSLDVPSSSEIGSSEASSTSEPSSMTSVSITPSSAPTPSSIVATSSVARSSTPPQTTTTSMPASVPASSSVSSTTAVSAAAQASAKASISGRFSEEMLTRAQAMLKDDLSAARWTQQYCSSHVGFCVPVHKNWWFKSFGATPAALWHVEISNGPIDLPGTGPVVVKLLSGTAEGQKATDGMVRTEGEAVIGYRSWTENRHIEVTAPAGLDAVVRTIIDGVKAVQ